jgi:glycosyltransferase involved in cell wall biosynthesis
MWLAYRYPRLLKIAKKLGKKVYRRLAKSTAYNESKSMETKIQENKSYKSSYFEAIRRYYMQAFSLFDLFHFNSSISEKVYKKFMPNIGGKVINLTHRGIKDNRKTPYIPMKDGYLNITFLGNADDRAKGFHLLEDALRNLLESFNLKRVKLHIWGYSQRNFFSQENIIYHGKYSHNDLKSIFSTSDILVFPSILWETYGFVALEALSYGIPVLASEKSGISDVIRQIDEEMVIFPSVESLADKIAEIYKNPNKLRKFHENILNTPWMFDMEKHCRIVETELYK